MAFQQTISSERNTPATEPGAPKVNNYARLKKFDSQVHQPLKGGQENKHSCTNIRITRRVDLSFSVQEEKFKKLLLHQLNANISSKFQLTSMNQEPRKLRTQNIVQT